jgi:hypothetical protein
LSFYAVYDGHAGKDAAAFAASHLHGKILASSHYPTDPVEAIKEAFNQTDEAFLEKVKVPLDLFDFFHVLCYQRDVYQSSYSVLVGQEIERKHFCCCCCCCCIL